MPIGKDVRNASDEDVQSDDEVLSVPVNRKRGRPTKDGKPKAAVVKEPAVARGRGRPRKGGAKGRGRPKKVAKTDEAENDENSCSSVAEEDDDDVKTLKSNAEEQAPAKGRGRPKKA